MKDYTNSQIALLIDEYIHKATYRDVLKDRFIDGLTFEKIAEKREISVRQAQNIVYKAQNVLFKYI